MPWHSIAKFVDRGAITRYNPVLRDQVSTFLKAANAGQIYPWNTKPFITKEYVKRSGTMQQTLNELAATAKVATPCNFHAYSQDRIGPLLQPVLFTRTWIQARPWASERLYWTSVLQVFDRADAEDYRIMRHLEIAEHYPNRKQLGLLEAVHPLLPLRAIWYAPPLGPYGSNEKKDIRPVSWTVPFD
jgi:hypothetical protein